jgi:2-iminobutanoate/2-iminopropanoate deaminase
MERRVIKTDQAPIALATYSQGILAEGRYVFVSGQVGLNPATQQLADGIEAQAEQALKNIQAILTEAGSSLANVVKATVLLHDINDYKAVNAVYARYFPQDAPARAAFGGLDLPIGALVEIECIALVNE